MIHLVYRARASARMDGKVALNKQEPVVGRVGDAVSVICVCAREVEHILIEGNLDLGSKSSYFRILTKQVGHSVQNVTYAILSNPWQERCDTGRGGNAGGWQAVLTCIGTS